MVAVEGEAVAVEGAEDAVVVAAAVVPQTGEPMRRKKATRCSGALPRETSKEYTKPHLVCSPFFQSVGHINDLF